MDQGRVLLKVVNFVVGGDVNVHFTSNVRVSILRFTKGRNNSRKRRYTRSLCRSLRLELVRRRYKHYPNNECYAFVLATFA